MDTPCTVSGAKPQSTPRSDRSRWIIHAALIAALSGWGTAVSLERDMERRMQKSERSARAATTVLERCRAKHIYGDPIVVEGRPPAWTTGLTLPPASLCFTAPCLSAIPP